MRTGARSIRGRRTRSTTRRAESRRGASRANRRCPVSDPWRANPVAAPIRAELSPRRRPGAWQRGCQLWYGFSGARRGGTDLAAGSAAKAPLEGAAGPLARPSRPAWRWASRADRPAGAIVSTLLRVFAGLSTAFGQTGFDLARNLWPCVDERPALALRAAPPGPLRHGSVLHSDERHDYPYNHDDVLIQASRF